MIYHDPYYDRSEVSHSDLTELDEQLSSRDKKDLERAFREGTLIDAMLTEPDRIDWYRKLIDGREDDFFDTAKRMYHAFKSNDTCMKIIKNCQLQKVSIADLHLTHQGIDFTIPARCKWDFFGTISGDIKSTVATTQKQFEAACMFMDYPRARAWYMDIAGHKEDLIIGISKVNQKIFFYPITNQMDIYQKGKADYTALAFKWWMLKG